MALQFLGMKTWAKFRKCLQEQGDAKLGANVTIESMVTSFQNPRGSRRRSLTKFAEPEGWGDISVAGWRHFGEPT